ncbi:MAG: DUF3592 domain-containing protein, partial [Planctomycetota bacterium]
MCRRAKAAELPAGLTMSQESRKRAGALACFILFALPFLLGGLWTLAKAAYTWHIYLDSAHWVEVPAVIEHVGLERHLDDDGASHSIDCRYSYEYMRKRYDSTRLGPMKTGWGERDLHERFKTLKEHARTRKPFPALVDAEKPGSAILFRETISIMYLGFPFGLILAGVGGGLIIGATVAYRRRKAKEAKRRELGDRPWLFRDDWRAFRVKASMAKSLLTAWTTGLGLSLFMSVFVIGFRDAPLAVYALILLFATAAGVLLLRAVWVTVRFLLRAGPELTLDRLPLVPGERFVGVARVHGHVEPSRVRAHVAVLETRYRKAGDSQERHTMGLQGPAVDFDPAAATYDGTNTFVPVAFDVSANLPPCRDTEEPDVSWRLVLTAPAFPVSLKAEFDLPVFEADQSEVMTRGGASRRDDG